MTAPKRATAAEVKIYALQCLIGLYLKEPEFNKEFREISGKYEPYLNFFMLSWLKSHQSAFPPEQLKSMTQKLGEKASEYKSYEQNMDGFILALDGLARRWELRIPRPLAGYFLFMQAFAEKVFSFGLSIISVSDFYILKIAQPQDITITAMDMMDLGQSNVLKKINLALSDYSRQLKKAGARDFPHELKRHASWWFEHYVKKKTYPEIDENPETVKRKVWEFRKLLNISLKE